MNLIREDRVNWWNRLEFISTQGWENIPYNTDVVIDQFDGTENAFLSNFYPFQITIDGEKYDTNEHYYQSKKPMDGSTDNKQLWTEKIQLASSPNLAKKMGKRCPLRPDWEKVKDFYMKAALIAKFRGTELEEKLLATGNAYLIEANCWNDNYWGICVLKDCQKCKDKKGLNKLGQFLMELRHIIRKHNMVD